NRNLGYFDTDREAARMWDTARVRLGNFFEAAPELNLGYEDLLDPVEVSRLRKQLEAEGAPTYPAILSGERRTETPDLSNPAPSTSNTAPGNEDPKTHDAAAARRAFLLKEVAHFSRRLTEVLAELNQSY